MTMPVARTYLRGCRVLVVEDEFFVAMELLHGLREAGAEVVGPVPHIDRAIDLFERDGRLDAAVLDIDLIWETSLPLADRLRAAGVPLVFATGCASETIPARFADVPLVEKPASLGRILVAVRAEIDAPRSLGLPRSLGRPGPAQGAASHPARGTSHEGENGPGLGLRH